MVGRSERTLRAWLHDVEGFREAAQAVPVATVEFSELSPVETLQLALNARRGDGNPDWSVRVNAAKALISMPEPEPVPIVQVPPGGVLVFPDVVNELTGGS